MLVGGRKGRLRYSRARHESAADRLLNVKVKKFNQARVNGGSNYDSLKVAKCLVIQLVTRMNGFVRFPLSLSTV